MCFCVSDLEVKKGILLKVNGGSRVNLMFGSLFGFLVSNDFYLKMFNIGL